MGFVRVETHLKDLPVGHTFSVACTPVVVASCGWTPLPVHGLLPASGFFFFCQEKGGTENKESRALNIFSVNKSAGLIFTFTVEIPPPYNGDLWPSSCYQVATCF